MMPNVADWDLPPAQQDEARGQSTTGRRCALIVGADYPMLTAKCDPNVIFWDADEVTVASKIPKCVTHLWIARDTLTAIKDSLMSQVALAEIDEDEPREIVVWECVLYGLKRRLMDFWAYEHNRTYNDVIGEDQTTITEGSARMDALKAAGARYASGQSLKFEAPLPLRGRRRSAEPEKLPSDNAPPEPRPTRPEPAAAPIHPGFFDKAAATLSQFDARVLRARFEGRGKAPEQIASEVGASKSTIETTLGRCRTKLEKAGIGWPEK